jgi:hypothetical protein
MTRIRHRTGAPVAVHKCISTVALHLGEQIVQYRIVRDNKSGTSSRELHMSGLHSQGSAPNGTKRGAYREAPAAASPPHSAGVTGASVASESAAAQRLDDIRALLADLDGAQLKEHTALFFEHGFWELNSAVRDMLEIFDHEERRAHSGARNIPDVKQGQDDSTSKLAEDENGRLWSKLVGPFYSEAEVEKKFQGVVPLADLLITETTDGHRLFPVFQFDDGDIVERLPDVLHVLLPSFDGWSAALWLNTPTKVWNGKSAIQMLREGNWETVIMYAERDVARKSL